MNFGKIILGSSLLAAAGASDSTSRAMEATGLDLVSHDSQSIHEDLLSLCEVTCEVSLSEGEKSTLSYSIKPYPKNSWYFLRPICSILMSNGAQIDYEPKMGAFWLTKDLNVKYTSTVIGTLKGRSLYTYSPKKFSEIFMKVSFADGVHPVHVTYSNGNSFPIQHPEFIRGEVLRKWVEEKI